MRDVRARRERAAARSCSRRSAALLLVGGLALVLVGLFANIKRLRPGRGRCWGGGAGGRCSGSRCCSPRLVRPLAAVAGWPLEKLRGLTGQLARENSQRNPGRTAATAAALMIGLALVALRDHLRGRDQGLDRRRDRRQLPGRAGDPEHRRLLDPIPAAAATAVAKVPGVQTVSTLRHAQAKVEGVAGKPRSRRWTRKTATKVLTLDLQDGTSDRRCATCATTRRSSTSPSPTPTASRSATRSGCWARPASGRSLADRRERSRTTPTCSAAWSSPSATMARDFGDHAGHPRPHQAGARAPNADAGPGADQDGC